MSSIFDEKNYELANEQHVRMPVMWYKEVDNKKILYVDSACTIPATRDQVIRWFICGGAVSSEDVYYSRMIEIDLDANLIHGNDVSYVIPEE